MATMLAYVETRGVEVRSVGLEAVTAARQAADPSGGGGGEVHAMVAGGPGIDGAAAILGRHGADVVLVVEHEGLSRYSPEAIAATAAARIGQEGYRAAFFSASTQGRDLAPRVAGALGVSLASDVTEFELGSDTLTVRHPAYAGKAIATLRLQGSPALLSLRPGAIPARATARTPRIEAIAPVLDPAAARVVVTATEPRGAAKLDLAEAPVVVSGGRGLKAPEHFVLLEELASAIGNAAVGATRAVTDDGWRDPADQIGQTGRVVSPDLYLAVGISGAIQHLAGMRTAKVIVAINRDKDAPIFKVADYGIVGDLFEVVPRLTEEIRTLRAEA